MPVSSRSRLASAASSVVIDGKTTHVYPSDINSRRNDAENHCSTHMDAPPALIGLQQQDEHGDISLGELVDAATIVLLFVVVGQPGDLLQPQVELRPVSELFSEANLFGVPGAATGTPQVVAVPTTGQLLAYSGYHWRTWVIGTGGISPCSTYGNNLDDVDPPAVFAGADFYNLYERLFFDDEPAVGFEFLVRIARLPRILPGVQTFQVSSFDRTEGNTDGGRGDPGLESYFYREGEAEVVLEASGPGQISRIWFAEFNDPGFANTRIQFFFDGADQVSYEIPVTTMMSGTAPPFVAPLVLNADRSSGGSISYVPIPFRVGVKVRLIGTHVHYQITYQLFAAATTCRPSRTSKTTHWRNICGSASDRIRSPLVATSRRWPAGRSRRAAAWYWPK